MNSSHWDGSLLLDHPIIDQDHEGLAAAVGDVIAAVAEPGAGDRSGWRAGIVAALGELRRRAIAHFESEEWIMDAAAYPNIDAHRAQHRSLLEEIDGFASGELTPDPESNTYAARFLNAWFEVHVRTWDKAFVHWLATLDPERPAVADAPHAR